ncbi:MAG: pyridoxamine kinase [Fibrobacterales bacterium]|nr:pyridoxamine kinase [Lentisphaeria bacterium]MBO7501494.1 pyridoxamine kinase [Fibrobacterales bacterium]MBP5187950.1 pyridoxamine kinase [Fibrobacterales bacterium]MBP5351140.1 pyridoxamine kinase [Fibrobacterales bacterium]
MLQKKIALINDITGFGRCSVAVMAPVVSAMKIQAVAVPTAILSTHTQFPRYFFDDYTPRMRDYIQTYKDLDMSFDAIATGFLGSVDQVDIVVDFIKTFGKKGAFTLVDPVMGDYGRLYRTYTPALCDKMKDLVRFADVLTPNLTELCSLMDVDYRDGDFSNDELEAMCRRLSSLGPRHIVVTGIRRGETQIMNFVFSRGEAPRTVMADRIGGDRSGTGDVISAVIAGMLLNGHGFHDSVKQAAEFASKCIAYCEENDVPAHWGLGVEMYLRDLTEEEE